MALNLPTIKDTTKDILYGTGLGEKPTLRIASGTASAGSAVVTFDIDNGDMVRPGDILSRYASQSSVTAYQAYVTGVSGNTLTAINGYSGPYIPDATDMTDMIFEVMPLASEYKIFTSIDTIIDRFLWPEVFEMAADQVEPDLSSGQVPLNERDEEILHAWQKIGTSVYPVSFHLEKMMDIALFPSGRMGSFDFIDQSPLFYAAKRRISIADSEPDNFLNLLIATGAAALCLGGAFSESNLDSSKKDSQARGQKDISQLLWRDFMVQKQSFAEDLSRDTVVNFVVERS